MDIEEAIQSIVGLFILFVIIAVMIPVLYQISQPNPAIVVGFVAASAMMIVAIVLAVFKDVLHG